MTELLHQSFVQNAFIVGTLIAVTAALTGYFIVLRAQAFASEALSHVGFAGATFAALIGISSLAGMAGFTAAAALGIGVLGKRLRGRDIEIGMILTFALGLGVLFLRLYANSASETMNVLFGSILSVTHADIVLTIIFGVGTLAAFAAIFRPLLFASIDPEVAEARGVPVGALSIVFMLLLAVTIASAVQVVGVLLVFALVIIPAATAQHLARTPTRSIAIAVILGILFTWAGLFLALISRYPVSFYIAAIAAAAYFAVVSARHLMKPHERIEEKHPNREVRNV